MSTSKWPKGCVNQDCEECEGFLQGEAGVWPCPVRTLELWRGQLSPYYRELLDAPLQIPADWAPGEKAILRGLLGYLRNAGRYWQDPKNHRNGLIVIGKVGTGKTHIAMKFAEVYFKTTGVRVEVASEQEYLAAYTAMWKEENWHSIKEYHRIRNARALLLDDLGSSKYTGARGGELNDLLITLHREGTMLILTSNLPLTGDEGEDSLVRREILDPRVVSRLAEKCIPMSTEGLSDWRLRNQEKLLTDFAGVK